MSDCQPMYNFIYSLDEGICFSELRTDECREYMEICDEKGYSITEIMCFTSENEFYQVHINEYFCLDYLVEIQKWHWKALEHHVSCYEREILSGEPDNPPVFYLSVTKGSSTKEENEEFNNIIREKQADPNFVPREFGVSKKVKMLVVD